MLATPGDLPIGPRWVYEVEWDGLRVLADVADDRVRLVTPGGRDVTGCFTELDTLARVAPDLLLDGVLVRVSGGRPDPGVLDPAGPPVTFMVFDILRLYGVPLVDRSQDERRATLERLDLRGAPAVALSPVYPDGPALRAATVQQGLPGVLAKRRDAPYRPGVGPAWVRVGNRQLRAYVVGGWSRHGGARTASGALLLGLPDGAALRYVGRVEPVPLGPELVLRLRELAVDAPPFAPRPPRADAAAARWCAPGIVVEVEHAGWTPGGRLRHPVFRAVRDDLVPAQLRPGR
jgi:bifunctional non-homologous end joining protein LigD